MLRGCLHLLLLLLLLLPLVCELDGDVLAGRLSGRLPPALRHSLSRPQSPVGERRGNLGGQGFVLLLAGVGWATMRCIVKAVAYLLHGELQLLLLW